MTAPFSTGEQHVDSCARTENHTPIGSMFDKRDPMVGTHNRQLQEAPVALCSRVKRISPRSSIYNTIGLYTFIIEPVEAYLKAADKVRAAGKLMIEDVTDNIPVFQSVQAAAEALLEKHGRKTKLSFN